MAKQKNNQFTPHGGEHLIGAPGRYESPGSGYEKLGDKIWPAPCVYEQMDKIMARDNGLRAYIAAMNEYVVEQFRSLAADKQQWWDDAYRQYQLDPAKNYRWIAHDRRIEPMPEKPPAEPKP